MRNQRYNLQSKGAIQALNLLIPNPAVYEIEKDTPFKKEFPKLFKTLGLLKEPYEIVLREDTELLCIFTPLRVPHPHLPQLQDELTRMEAEGVISPVTEPTEWCSGIVIAPKRNGKIRLCVDLTALNKAVKREVHSMSTVDQNLAMIQESKVFSKLDANSGFWQIPLDRSSRLLTTFVHPLGVFALIGYPLKLAPLQKFSRKGLAD